ncbi:MAG: NAD-dependent epimerase/dehydratase family protein [Pseudomonadota bacterium]
MRKTQPKNLACTYIGRYDYSWWRWDVQAWDAIVHLANISPERVILTAKGNNCRLLYCSSGAVYHQFPDAYGMAKRQREAMCLNAWRNVVVARLFTFFNAPGHACAEFIKEARKGWPVRIWGDGTAVRSYMHPREMARWMWAILLRGRSGEAYDVGSDKPITMLELARMVTDRWPAPILIENGVDRVPVYLPKGIEKTRKLLTCGRIQII